MNDNNAEDYAVGYGKPPRETRFVKGHSGNLKGRPKGAKNLETIVSKVGKRRVKVTGKHGTRSMLAIEAMVYQLTVQALSGDIRAIREYLQLHRQVAAACKMIIMAGKQLVQMWPSKSTFEQRELLRDVIERIVVHETGLQILVVQSALRAVLLGEQLTRSGKSTQDIFTVTIEARVKTRLGSAADRPRWNRHTDANSTCAAVNQSGRPRPSLAGKDHEWRISEPTIDRTIRSI